MSDVTGALGLSAGSIYRYFHSKEALFDLSLRHAIDPASADLSALPHRVASRDETIAYLRTEVEERARIRSLEAALSREAVVDGRAEFEEIIREFFRRSVQYRRALTLVERCALDWPDLAALWFKESRKRTILQLEQYLEDRSRRGVFRSIPDALPTAGLMVAIIVFQAIKRHEDPYPVSMSDDTAEQIAVDNLVHAYLK
jgi:AcrR family transcriptional regulator